MNDMMNRNQNREKLSTKNEESLYVQSFNYKYTETTPQLITESKLKKQVLSPYTFNNIFSKIIKSQKYLQIKALDNEYAKLCYLNTDINQCIQANIKLNKRYERRDRIDLGIYCKHKYKLNGKLDINKYDSC